MAVTLWGEIDRLQPVRLQRVRLAHRKGRAFRDEAHRRVLGRAAAARLPIQDDHGARARARARRLLAGRVVGNHRIRRRGLRWAAALAQGPQGAGSCAPGDGLDPKRSRRAPRRVLDVHDVLREGPGAALGRRARRGRQARRGGRPAARRREPSSSFPRGRPPMPISRSACID